jgi:hypothetical protein
MESKLVVDKQAIDELVRYLGTKPYHEVYKIIPILKTAESVDSFLLKNREQYKTMFHNDEAEKGD